MKFSTLLLCSFISIAFAVPLFDLEKALQTTNYNPTEQQLIDAFSHELYLIDNFNATNTTKCEKCIKRLQVGKSIVLTKPNLVYPIFTKWCIDNKVHDATTCKLDYGRNTVDNATMGTNFANLLYLMEPDSYDGQLYCHYQDSKSCPLPKTPEIDMSSYWPAKKPEHEVAPAVGNETYNVLHVSDFHIELDYKIGSEANCSQYMCCTDHNYNKVSPPEGYNYTFNLTQDQINNLSYYPAWYDADYELQRGDYISDALSNDTIWIPAPTFGHYVCDAPEVLINSSLKSVAQYQEELGLDFQFSIFTGDLVDHDEDQYLNYTKNIESEEIIFRDVKATLKNIPVYPVLGNHDTYPYAQLAQQKSGFANLFDWNAELMGDLWEDYGWLNTTTARYARAHYTGFAVTTKTNLKVIALNSNAYYASNLYNYWNATDVDSYGQFQFLIDELIDSETKDQRVWIIAHIPFVQEALPVPAEVFTQIVKRFSPYTIAGIFFGHTHMDQFNILYDGAVTNKTEENVVNMAWISQAVTPLTDNNPSWRYYTVDTKTHSVMNSYNYYTKLNDTFYNESEEPVWEFEYSARESYANITEWPSTAPLNATFWHRVANGVNASDEVAQTYNNYKRRFSPYVTDCIGTNACDGSYCFLASFTLKDYDACLETFHEPEFY